MIDEKRKLLDNLSKLMKQYQIPIRFTMLAMLEDRFKEMPDDEFKKDFDRAKKISSELTASNLPDKMLEYGKDLSTFMEGAPMDLSSMIESIAKTDMNSRYMLITLLKGLFN